MDYLDFEVEVGPGQGRDYPVEVVRSPAGERQAVMHFPFDELELENRLLRLQNALLATSTGPRRRMGSPHNTAVQELGGALFAALMSGDIRSCFDLSRHEASIQGKGLRIKLRMKAPELAALPWEFLYDPTNAEYVALSRYTPIVRYIDLPRSVPPLPVSPPLRILGMVVSPEGLAPLNVEREKERMERALSTLRENGMVELTWLEGGTWYDLQRAMRGGPWHVFHFVGHGKFDVNVDEGSIALAGEHGGSDDLTASQLGRLLADHPSLRLVLLNACEGARSGSKDIFSGTASILVQKGIPAVLAMQYEITDRAAIEFARTFYEAISDGLPLDASVSEARKAISLSRDDTVEWGTPVLYMRSSDGVLFKVDGAAAVPSRPAPPPRVVETEPSTPADDELEQRRSLEAAWRAEWEAQQATPTPPPKVEAQPPPPVTITPPIIPASEATAPPSTPSPDVTMAPGHTQAPVPSTQPPEPSTQPPVPTGPDQTADPEVAPAAPPNWAGRLPAQPAGPNWLARPPDQPVRSTQPAGPAGPSWPTQPAGPAWGQSPTDAGLPEFVAQGIDGQLTVSQVAVGIRRRGSWAARLRKGDKVVPLSSVTNVHLHGASGQGGGFVQLMYQGGDQSVVGGWSAGSHHDTVLFNQLQEPAFVRAKELIDESRGKE